MFQIGDRVTDGERFGTVIAAGGSAAMVVWDAKPGQVPVREVRWNRELRRA